MFRNLFSGGTTTRQRRRGNQRQWPFARSNGSTPDGARTPDSTPTVRSRESRDAGGRMRREWQTSGGNSSHSGTVPAVPRHIPQQGGEVLSRAAAEPAGSNATEPVNALGGFPSGERSGSGVEGGNEGSNRPRLAATDSSQAAQGGSNGGSGGVGSEATVPGSGPAPTTNTGETSTTDSSTRTRAVFPDSGNRRRRTQPTLPPTIDTGAPSSSAATNVSSLSRSSTTPVHRHRGNASTTDDSAMMQLKLIEQQIRLREEHLTKVQGEVKELQRQLSERSDGLVKLVRTVSVFSRRVASHFVLCLGSVRT